MLVYLTKSDLGSKIKGQHLDPEGHGNRASALTPWTCPDFCGRVTTLSMFENCYGVD